MRIYIYIYNIIYIYIYIYIYIKTSHTNRGVDWSRTCCLLLGVADDADQIKMIKSQPGTSRPEYGIHRSRENCSRPSEFGPAVVTHFPRIRRALGLGA